MHSSYAHRRLILIVRALLIKSILHLIFNPLHLRHSNVLNLGGKHFHPQVCKYIYYVIFSVTNVRGYSIVRNNFLTKEGILSFYLIFFFFVSYQKYKIRHSFGYFQWCFFLVMFEKTNVYPRTIHTELLCMSLALWLLNGLSMLTIGLAVADHTYLLLDLNPANLKIIGLYWLRILINVLDTAVFLRENTFNFR